MMADSFVHLFLHKSNSFILLQLKINSQTSEGFEYPWNLLCLTSTHMLLDLTFDPQLWL